MFYKLSDSSVVDVMGDAARAENVASAGLRHLHTQRRRSEGQPGRSAQTRVSPSALREWVLLAPRGVAELGPVEAKPVT